MKNWYSLNLGDAMMAHQPLEEISEAFETFKKKNGNSSEFAIFTRNDSEGRLHCEVTAYFSPATSEVGRLFGASKCDQPTRVNLDLFVGDEMSWKILFGS